MTVVTCVVCETHLAAGVTFLCAIAQHTDNTSDFATLSVFNYMTEPKTSRAHTVVSYTGLHGGFKSGASLVQCLFLGAISSDLFCMFNFRSATV